MKAKLYILIFSTLFFACNKSEALDPIEAPEVQFPEVEQPSEKYIELDVSTIFQTVEGFGAGIKRRTEDLYKLNDALRQKIEAYCFKDLEVNMIRFFIYHDLEPVNDNNDPNSLDETKLDWTRYDSDNSNWRSRYVGEALNNSFSLSTNGFDHVIGNCNSAPGWLKTNGQHNNGGTLITGGEDEYSEFLVAFLKGMKSRYNINVTAISPTNEPDYEVSYESMNTSPSQLSGILTNLDAKLEAASLSAIKIISPECFRVHSSTNASKGATNYVNALFSNYLAKSSVDVVATHTYADKNHTADWASLKTASSGKPVWVTESASLKSTDISMTDAANYIKWMVRGFNEGGMTAYMMHLFYEEADDEKGYSSLVAWKENGEIILPKRYFALKHFANLIKPGYQRIESKVVNASLFVVAFKSPDQKKVVVQVFNEGDNQNISLDVPEGSQAVLHYITSNKEGEDFSLSNNLSISSSNGFITVDIPSRSMHSLVYNIIN